MNFHFTLACGLTVVLLILSCTRLRNNQAYSGLHTLYTKVISYRDYIFLLALSTLFFSFTFFSAPNEFSDTDVLFLMPMILAVCLIQYWICCLIKNEIICSLLLSLFSLINVASLNLLMNHSLTNLATYQIIIFCLLLIFIFNTFFNIIRQHAHKGAVFSLTLLLIALLFSGVISWEEKYYFTYDEELNAASAENIKLVDFKVNPNVYIISFDALIPKSIYKKHFQTNEPTDYHRVLDSNFNSFTNFFADEIPTSKSLNSLLLFDKEHFLNMKTKFRYTAYNGITPSPLFEVFKHNGYESTTLFQTGYFGKKKGPFVDNYLINDKTEGVCQFVPNTQVKHVFLGYCAASQSRLFQNSLNPSHDNKDSINFLLSTMDSLTQKNTPQILLAYLFIPEHTPHDYQTYDDDDFNAYKQSYIEKSTIAAKHLEKIINFINSKDPNSILYVFGDHGPYLTQSIEFNDDKKFVIQDRFGVYGGIYPKDQCKNSLSSPYEGGYTTVLRGMYMIVRCLTDGEEVFKQESPLYLRKFGKTNRERSYETYLYE